MAGRVCGCSGVGAGVAYAVLTDELDHVVSLVCVALSLSASLRERNTGHSIAYPGRVALAYGE